MFDLIPVVWNFEILCNEKDSDRAGYVKIIVRHLNESLLSYECKYRSYPIKYLFTLLAFFEYYRSHSTSLLQDDTHEEYCQTDKKPKNTGVFYLLRKFEFIQIWDGSLLVLKGVEDSVRRLYKLGKSLRNKAFCGVSNVSYIVIRRGHWSHQIAFTLSSPGASRFSRFFSYFLRLF